MSENNLHEIIDRLISGPQYAMAQKEKDEALFPILRQLCLEAGESCPEYGRFIGSLGGDPQKWEAVSDITPVPVSMFKIFGLSTIPPEKVVRELHSSSTTGQAPSRIFVDKTTAFRQAKALVAILKEHIGKSRRPLLVLDSQEKVGAGASITARGAAIRGIANFATETVFAMSTSQSGNLEPDFDAIRGFFDRNGGAPVLLFGFTYVVWTSFTLEAERQGLSFTAKDAILLHSGGWKKLVTEAVSKSVFTQRTAAVLGCPPSSILDFYGMVEQVGTVFIDCEAGNKHAPAFADILVRMPNTFAPGEPGQEGIIEVVSGLPTSYPGHVLLTEDRGVILGRDDCACGRMGNYFRFLGRVEEAEIRGCGDTYAQMRSQA
jgi:hypothetical protein